MSGYWSGFDWLCPGCGQRNRFKKEVCAHCDHDPDAVVQGWQLVYMGDKFLGSADYSQAQRVYSRAIKTDPSNFIAKDRIVLAESGVSVIPAREREREATYPSGAVKDSNFAEPGLAAKPRKKKEAVGVKPAAAEWKCAYCTFMNAARAKKCEMCENPKFEAAPVEDEGVLEDKPAAVSMWTCTMCSQKNLMSRKYCSICSFMGSPDQLLGAKAEEKVDDEDFQKMTRLMRLMGIDDVERREFVEMMQTCKSNVEKFPELTEIISSFMSLLNEFKLKDARSKLKRGVDLVTGEKAKIEDSMKPLPMPVGTPESPAGIVAAAAVIAPVSVKEKLVPILEMYETLLKVAFVDNSLSEASIAYLAQVRLQYGITDADHEKCISEIGVSKESYKSMVKKGVGMQVASKDCVICMDELATHVVLDCMHLSVCANCKDLAKSSKSCPECRGAISDLRKIY